MSTITNTPDMDDEELDEIEDIDDEDDEKEPEPCRWCNRPGHWCICDADD